MGLQPSVHSFETVELKDREFSLLSRLIYDACGINLGEHKRALLRSRLMSRLRMLGLRSFGAYYEYVTNEDSDGVEIAHMLDAISTNLTEFFREPQHFEYLSRKFFARWEKENTIRILSAGCSSGEEPYTISICALNHFGVDAHARVSIKAGDLSRRMLARAQAGIYSLEKLKLIPLDQLHKYFLKGVGASEGLVKVAPEVRRLVSFEPLNLTEDLPFSEPFHAIFCRNVAIYFDRATQTAVFERLERQLIRGGNLFLGHSESMASKQNALKYVQPTVYEKL